MGSDLTEGVRQLDVSVEEERAHVWLAVREVLLKQGKLAGGIAARGVGDRVTKLSKHVPGHLGWGGMGWGWVGFGWGGVGVGWSWGRAGCGIGWGGVGIGIRISLSLVPFGAAV